MATPKPNKYLDTKLQSDLLDEVQQHEYDSYKYMDTLRGKFDEKESMLIVQLEDSTSKKANSKIFDPRLSTIVFERAARVMAQNPKGKAYAVSKDDIGKNILMNMNLRYFEKNANEQYSHLIKLRMLDLYSLVYGSMFALVPWRVNEQSGYIGPELNILPIRDCRPQPGVKSPQEMDWFGVRNTVSIQWLLQQDNETWMNIDALAAQLKDSKSQGDTKTDTREENRSYVERTYYPNRVGDAVYPNVEIFTEYRGDKWITWSPQIIDKKESRPFVLRVVDDPYPEYMLPIVAKHAFPLLDSPIGLGEFERGKTLQYAINSLINLYMDGIKYSIFPPIAVNPDNVSPTTMKWGAGEFWYMNNPSTDVQPLNINPRGLDTFNSTYGFLVAALNNQSGSTDTSTSGQVAPSLGKTPDAIKTYAQRENARDEWDRFMMEDTIKQVYQRWIALTVDKMETDIEMRLFGAELEELQKVYPDAVELYDSGRANVKIKKNMLAPKYDYEIESGSTVKPDIENEQANLTSILKAVIENPTIMQSFDAEGKMVSVPELFKRWMIAAGVKDYDKIILAKPQEPEQAEPQNPTAAQYIQGVPPDPTQAAIPPQAPAESQIPIQQDIPQFEDPQIQAMVAQILGNTQGIPPQQPPVVQ